MFFFAWLFQGKIQEASEIFKQLQDQLEGITERMQQLQPRCAELKNQVQEHNRNLKKVEVHN